MKCSTFWYRTVSSDVVWDGIREENPYKRRHRFASPRTISTPTHCDKALQGTQHCNRAEIVELSISNSFRMHAFGCAKTDCTYKKLFSTLDEPLIWSFSEKTRKQIILRNCMTPRRNVCFPSIGYVFFEKTWYYSSFLWSVSLLKTPNFD